MLPERVASSIEIRVALLPFHRALDCKQTEDIHMTSYGKSTHTDESDLSFRPVSYSADERTANKMIARLSGVERRDAVRNMLRSKPYRQWAALMAREELTEDEAVWAGIKRQTGPIPTYLGTAIEIVRIGINSTLGDEVLIYAVVSDESYEYIIRSSMEEEGGKIVQSFDKSDLPLTLGELVELIDRSFHAGDVYAEGGLMIGNWESGLEAGAEAAIDFVSIDSPYYPTLADYYQAVATRWVSDHTNSDDVEE